MELRPGDIEVVVLVGGDDPAGADLAGADLDGGRRRGGVRPRPWSAAGVALVALLVVLAGPVATPDPVEPDLPAATGSDPGPGGADPRPGDADGCPPPQSRRLWCSFVDDGACCPEDEPDAGAPAAAVRLATSPSTTSSGAQTLPA